MTTMVKADPTATVLRHLHTLVFMRGQDRNHTGRMDVHREQADDLLDELLALHPEMRTEAPPLGPPQTDAAAQATPVQADTLR